MSNNKTQKEKKTINEIVSIIIPTYKRPNLLSKALKSIQNQTYKDIEILIIDDDTNTSAKETVLSFNDSRLKYLPNERKKGGNGARNTGIIHAKGEFIAFLDDDDEWYPDKIKMQLSKMQSLDKTWGGCYCGFDINMYNGIISFCPSLEGSVKRDFLLSNLDIGATSSLFIKRHAIDQIGLFDEEMQRHQDLEYLIRFLRYYKLAVVSNSLLKVNGHNPPNALKSEQAKNQFFKKIKQDIEELSLKDQKKFYAHHYRELALFFSAEGNFKKTWIYTIKSLQHSILFPSRYVSIILNLLKYKIKIDFLPIWDWIKKKYMKRKSKKPTT